MAMKTTLIGVLIVTLLAVSYFVKVDGLSPVHSKSVLTGENSAQRILVEYFQNSSSSSFSSGGNSSSGGGGGGDSYYSGDCVTFPQLEWLEQHYLHLGGWIEGLIVIYAFIGIAIICDEYFEPTMHIFCERLRITPDVAGASFMSFGNSAPEIFIDLIAVLSNLIAIYLTKKGPSQAGNEAGAGTIIGSGVFSFLFIIGISALFTKESFKLSPSSVLRDTITYAISVVSLLVILLIGVVPWYIAALEALYLVVCYIIYLIVLRLYNPALNLFLRRKEKKAEFKRQNSVLSEIVIDHLDLDRDPLLTNVDDDDMGLIGDEENYDEEAEKESIFVRLFRQLAAKISEKVKEEIDDLHWKWSYIWSIPLFIIKAPILLVFFLTIPPISWADSKKWYLRHLYIVTFVVNVVYIGILSWILLESVIRFACVFNIPHLFIGLVVLGIGSDVPDVMNALTASRRGHTDMAVSSAIGGQIINVFIGLGLPWLIAAIAQYPVFLKGAGIWISVIVLAISVIFFFFIILVLRWSVNKIAGVILIFGYILFLVYQGVTIVWPNYFTDSFGFVKMCFWWFVHLF